GHLQMKGSGGSAPPSAHYAAAGGGGGGFGGLGGGGFGGFGGSMGQPTQLIRSGCASAVRRTGFTERQSAHSCLMPANLIPLAHFSVSSAMSLPKSAGEPASTVPPSSASRALILGSASAALVCRLSLSMMAADVALGAPKPHQLLSS